MTKKSDLASFIEVLQSNLAVLESNLTDDLKKRSLLLGDWDPLLLEAHKAEYPTNVVGHLPKYVNFQYYKAMHRRKTGSATRIRKRYEEASRDITGNGKVDYLLLVWAMKYELQLLNDLIATNNLSDEILDEFNVWLQTAIVTTKQLYKRITVEDQSKVDTLSSERARKIQASSKIKLNRLNLKTEDTLQELHLSIGPMAKKFYSKLAEANVSDNTDRFRRDQSLRNRLFNTKVESLLDTTLKAESMRQRIKALAESGKSLPSSGPRVMVKDIEVPEAELLFWLELEEDNNKFKFLGQHQDLSDLDEGDPHPQYLLAEGGVVAGDIEVLDKLRIDGVDLSEHRHTGEDGSKRIHGDDLIDASFKDHLVSEEKPPRPTDMSVKKFFEEANPPVVTIGANIEWVSDDIFTHEMETRRITKDDEGIGDSLANDLTGIYLMVYLSSDENVLLRIDPATRGVSEYPYWDYAQVYLNYSNYVDSPGLAFTEYEGKSLLVLADQEMHTKTEAVPPASSDDWEPRDVNARLYGTSSSMPQVQSYQGNIFSLNNGQLAISRDGGDTWTTKGGFGRISSYDGVILEPGDPDQIMQEVPPGYDYETYDELIMTPGGTITIYNDTSNDELANGSFFWSDDLGETWEYYPGQEDLPSISHEGLTHDVDFTQTLRSDDGVIIQMGGAPDYTSQYDYGFPYNQIFWARFSIDDAQTWIWLEDYYGNDLGAEGFLFQGKNNKIMQVRVWDEYVSFYELNLGTAAWQHVSHMRNDGGGFTISRPMLSRDGLLVFTTGIYADIYQGDLDIYVNYSYDNGKTWQSVLAYRTPAGWGSPYIGKATVIR